jgi:hypothetical protein
MNVMELAVFNQAVILAFEGQKQAAYSQFKMLAQHHPNHTGLWLWIAFTTANPAEAEDAIERAKNTDPDNPHVQNAPEWLLLRKQDV